MDRRRAGWAVAALLAAGVASAATQGPPAYVYTGAAPSGACTGTRVWIDALGTGTYYCNAGTWAAVTGGSGGAPTTVPYWTGAADGTLSAEHNLGALGTGLVINTGGTPSIYAGAACTAPNVARVLSASGAVTCYQVPYSGLANPTGDTTLTFPSGSKTLWEFSGATDYAFSIHGTGAFTGSGDLVHLHLQGTPGVTAGADVLHVEWEDVDATGLRLNGPSAVSPALVATGTVNITGAVTASSFAGPLTGAVTGNASTATALAANPTDCGAGTKATGIDASGNLTCSAVAVADISATGTPSSSTYLRGDGTWSSPPGGSGGGNFVAVDLDFGTGASIASQAVVGQTWVTTSSRIVCAPTMHQTSSRDEGAEDAVLEQMTVAVHSRVAGTGFTLTAAPANAPASGIYQFACTGGDGGSAGVLTAWVSSTSATGLCSTSSGNCTATSLSRTCSATGGSGTYTYAWTHVAGTSATAVNPSSASTTFQRNAAAGADPGTDYTGTMRCTVTDTGTGGTATAEVVYTSTHVIVI